MRVQVTCRYRTVAPFMGLLATVLPLQAAVGGQPVLDAPTVLEALRVRRQLNRDDVIRALVPAA